jgi:predicted AAA+ superfamily ATPase
MPKNSHSLEITLLRIAEALERLSPAEPPVRDFKAADAFIWQADEDRFAPVAHVNRMPIALLKSIDRMRDILLANTENFARGLPANNALLWGSRGMGKSSLVKAVHAEVAARQGKAALKLIEIHREDISSLPRCLSKLRERPQRFIVFCDDLSFDADDTSYKSLKAVLEGGIEGRPENVVFYATSNRRHLMPREMRVLWAESPARTATRRSAGMGDDPRFPLRPRCLAIHPGFGGAPPAKAWLRPDPMLRSS